MQAIDYTRRGWKIHWRVDARLLGGRVKPGHGESCFADEVVLQKRKERHEAALLM
jgi:hypothetical protein